MAKKTTKSSKSSTEAVLPESTEKIERFREIIFGAQSREYSQRFEHLSRDIARLQLDISELAGQLREFQHAQENNLREIEARFNKHVQDQNKQFTGDVQELDDRFGGQLREVNSQLGEQIRLQEEALNKRVTDIHSQLTQRGDELQLSMRQAEEAVRVEMRDSAESLMQEKLDRSVFGDMLVQMGSNLKGSEQGGFTELLEELIDKVE